MREIDFVNAFFDYGPKKLVAAFVAAVVAFVAITGNVAPVMWYVTETARSVTETYLPALQDMVSSILTDLAPDTAASTS